LSSLAINKTLENRDVQRQPAIAETPGKPMPLNDIASLMTADYEKLTTVVKAPGITAPCGAGHLVMARSKATSDERPVIPGRCQRVRAKRGPMTGSASNPESRDSGSGADAPSRNDGAWIASSLLLRTMTLTS
jgi:hypothetical protein